MILVLIKFTGSFRIWKAILCGLLEVVQRREGSTHLLAYCTKCRRDCVAICDAKQRAATHRRRNSGERHMCPHRTSPGRVEELSCVSIHTILLLYLTSTSIAYSHISDGRIRPAKITNRSCPTEMLIFIPVDKEHSHKALVVLRNPHNHPAHPKTKPSAQDRIQLGTAVKAAGLTGLTVQKLLNGQFGFR